MYRTTNTTTIIITTNMNHTMFLSRAFLISSFIKFKIPSDAAINNITNPINIPINIFSFFMFNTYNHLLNQNSLIELIKKNAPDRTRIVYCQLTEPEIFLSAKSVNATPSKVDPLINLSLSILLISSKNERDGRYKNLSSLNVKGEGQNSLIPPIKQQLNLGASKG